MSQTSSANHVWHPKILAGLLTYVRPRAWVIRIYTIAVSARMRISISVNIAKGAELLVWGIIMSWLGSDCCHVQGPLIQEQEELWGICVSISACCCLNYDWRKTRPKSSREDIAKSAVNCLNIILPRLFTAYTDIKMFPDGRMLCQMHPMKEGGYSFCILALELGLSHAIIDKWITWWSHSHQDAIKRIKARRIFLDRTHNILKGREKS